MVMMMVKSETMTWVVVLVGVCAHIKDVVIEVDGEERHETRLMKEIK